MITFSQQWRRNSGGGASVCDVSMDGERIGSLVNEDRIEDGIWDPSASLIEVFGESITGHRNILKAQRMIREAFAAQ